MDVLVDINRVNEARSIYRRYGSELKDTINKLKSAVDRIEAQWQGAAKDSFANSHFPKLYESMMDHNKRIEYLARELDCIAEEFSSLGRDIDNRTR